MGALPPVLLDKRNTARDVWADTAYRSNANERHLANTGLRSRTPQEAERQAYTWSASLKS